MKEIDEAKAGLNNIVVNYHMEAVKAAAAYIEHYPSIVETVSQILDLKGNGWAIAVVKDVSAVQAECPHCGQEGMCFISRDVADLKQVVKE